MDNREPIRTTIRRTVLIAIVAGAIVARTTRISWLQATGLMLWFSFGGHVVELVFLNWIRPRLGPQRSTLALARIATWLAGGFVLGAGMLFTAQLMHVAPVFRTFLRWSGPAFVLVELIAHLPFKLRGRPSFYSGDG